MKLIVKLGLIFSVIFANFYSIAAFKKVCYYTNWSQFRASGAEFYPEDINPELCTHVIYAFAKIENYTLAHTEDSDIGIDNGPGMYERIMALKLLSPSLKILLAVGGWAQGSAGFDTVVESDETLERFSTNSIGFLKKWKFDGLDVDWEFPVVKKLEFTKLLAKLRTEFDKEKINGYHLELSIAVSAGQATIDTSYEVDKISESVDFVNLMAYDFHGSWSTKTGFHSGLYAKPGDLTWENTLNVDWSVKYWIEKGCPKEKLILGLAFYGRGFKLVDPSSNQVGAPSRGSSKAGPYTKEDGFLSYFEICKIIKENNLVESFDNDYQTPSVVYGSEWIGYENQESIIQKANYIKDKCLGGSMVWTVDFDDYKGEFCNQGVYPLLTIINEVLKDSQCYESNPETTTNLKTSPTTTAQEIITTDNTTPFESTLVPIETTTESLISTSIPDYEFSTFESTTSSEPTSQIPEESTLSPIIFVTPETSAIYETTTEYQQTELTSTESTSTELPTTATETIADITFVTKESSRQTDFEASLLTTKQASAELNICKNNDFMRSADGCEYYQVCLKGFEKPVATLKCPNNYWFDSDEMTCVKERPNNCDTQNTIVPYITIDTTFEFTVIDQKTTTRVPMVTPDTTIVAYVTPENSKKPVTTPTISTSTTPLTSRPTTTSTTTPKPKPTTLTRRTTSSIKTTPTPQTTRFRPTIPTTTKFYNSDPKKFVCPIPSGIFANPNDCRRFWHCSNNMAYDKQCPGNLYFDVKLSTCSWSSESCKQSGNIYLDQDTTEYVNIVRQQKLTKPPYVQPKNVFMCPKTSGFFENTKDCKSFWQCVRGVPILRQCPGKLLFNANSGVCDFKSQCTARSI